MNPWILILSLVFALGSVSAETPGWQPSQGHTQVPIWPGTPPDAQFGPPANTETAKSGKVENVSRPTMTVYSAKATNTGVGVVVFPGGGYHGCLPKDVRAFRATASALGVSSVVSLLTTVDAVNQGRRDRVVTLARQAAGGSLAGRRVAVLGVAFKPDSDDVRDSASLAVCDRLAAEGAIVSVHDPVAMPGAAKKRPGLTCAPSVPEAARDADLLLHLTEWSDYRAIDPAALARVVARRVIIDARCCLDADLT
jgi:nucleotide sugar dehydrogenase